METAELYFERGWACFELAYEESRCSYEQVIADFNQAVTLDPGNYLYLADRGWAYINIGEIEMAIADYTQAIEMEPNDPTLYQSRGMAFSELGNQDAALADLNQAIDLDPAISDFYLQRSWIYSLMGEYEQAIANLDVVIESNPNDAHRFSGREPGPRSPWNARQVGVGRARVDRHPLCLKQQASPFEVERMADQNRCLPPVGFHQVTRTGGVFLCGHRTISKQNSFGGDSL